MNNVNYIGATGLYPIEEIITNTSNNLIDYTINTSNNLINYIDLTSNYLINYTSNNILLTSNSLINYINTSALGLSTDIKYNYQQEIDFLDNKNAVIYGDDKIYFKTGDNVYETRVNNNGFLEILVKYNQQNDPKEYELIEEEYPNGKWIAIRDLFLNDLLQEVQRNKDNLLSDFLDFVNNGVDFTAGLQTVGGTIVSIGGIVGATLVGKALADGINFGKDDANSSNNQQLLLNYLLLSMIDEINNNSNNIRLTSNYSVDTSNVISNRLSNTSNEISNRITTNATAIYSYIDDRWDKTGTTLYYNDGPVGIGTSSISPNKIFEVSGNVLFNNELQSQKVAVGTSVIQLNKVLDVKGDALFEDELHANKKISTSQQIEALGYIKTSSNLFARKAAINKAEIKDGYDLDLQGNFYVLGSNVMDLPDSLLEVPILNNTLAQTNLNLKIEINKGNQGVLKEIVNNEEWFYNPFNILFDSTYNIVVGQVGGAVYNSGGLNYYGKGGFGGEMMDNLLISISLWCYRPINFGNPPLGTILYTKILEGKHLDFLNDSMKFRVLFRRFLNFGVYTNEITIQYRGAAFWSDRCVYTLENNLNNAFNEPVFYTFNMSAITCQIYANGVLKASSLFPASVDFKITRLTIPSDKITEGAEVDQVYRWNFLYFHKDKNLSNLEALYLYRFAADKLTYTLRVNGSLRTNALYVDVIYQDFKPILWTDFTQNVANTSNNLQAQIDAKEPLINLGATQYVLINNTAGKVSASQRTLSQLNTLNEIDTNQTIQNQLNNKLSMYVCMYKCWNGFAGVFWVFGIYMYV
jgi:hypothetical protein